MMHGCTSQSTDDDRSATEVACKPSTNVVNKDNT